MPNHDPVNHPSHYADTRIECIDALEAMIEKWPGIPGYLAGNIVKYIWRYRQKGGIESLEKAAWYLNRLIMHERATQAPPVDEALRAADDLPPMPTVTLDDIGRHVCGAIYILPGGIKVRCTLPPKHDAHLNEEFRVHIDETERVRFGNGMVRPLASNE